MSVIPIPADSIDAFIAGQLKGWLKAANVDLLLTFHRALHNQQAAAERVKTAMAGVPSLVNFATDLLVPALRAEGLAQVDVRTMQVYIEDDLPMPSAAPRVHTPWRTVHRQLPLLTAALHNFREIDIAPTIHRRAHLRDAQGNTLPLSFEAFARCCRRLDIGGQYQRLLHAQLFPKSRPPAPEGYAHEAVKRLVEENLRANMEVALRMARLKSELDELDYLRLLPVFAAKPVVPAVTGLATPRQLFLLGKRIHGVVAWEMRDHPGGPLQGIVCWIPQDPYQPVTRHASWDSLYRSTAKRLRAPHYRSFFNRFLSERDKPAFTVTLGRLLEAGSHQAPVELDGRNFPIDTPVFTYLRALQVDKLLDDARVLAVPTADEDADERRQWWEIVKSAGLDALTLAALFVPVVGEVMFAVAAVDIVSEVYEGYAAWKLGDREAALEHVFGVAENVALGVVVGVGQVGVGRLLKRIPFVDALTPVHKGEGRFRLGQLPASAHHIDGGGALMRKFGGDLAQVSDHCADRVLRITGLEQNHLRHLHVQEAQAPARLRDALARYTCHELYPELSGSAFERTLAARQAPASAAGALLIRDFPGLPVAGAEEIIAQATGEQVETLLDTGRVPLAMAERARWFLRERRLDRALMGFEHDGAVNDDTMRLVLGWVTQQAPWPASMRIELRQGEVRGRLVAGSGAMDAAQTKVIIQTEQGYQLADSPSPVLGQGFLPCLIQTFEADQRAILGGPQLDVRSMGEQLARLACADREKTAQLIGLPPLAGRYRPPPRIADGRVGYPLSGGGESSRQAIRRGIHEIFPTFTEAELDAYLHELRGRGIGLWRHLSDLQRQLESLRTALDTWQQQRVSMLDGFRRRRVANQIRRAWRRKTEDLTGDEYVLHIEGEQVGSLPTLPAAIDFNHIRRLTLRNMALEQVDENFLRRFGSIRELDLRGNQLTRLPAGIEHLSGLRSLRLSGNRITIDSAANGRLASLSMLQVLDLNYNPLGQVPDLSGLRHLREVTLRATGLDGLPAQDHMPWRGLIDVRENRIRQINGELRTLDARLRRMSLHDNPLDQASEASIDASRSESSATRSNSYRHAIADGDVREQWLGEAPEGLRNRRMQIWTQLSEDPQSTDLFRFLADFAGSEDFQGHPRYYRSRIWQILELCTDNTDVREAVYWQTQGPRTCEDRLLIILSNLEVRAHIALHSAGAGMAQAEQTLLRLGRSLYRLDQVDTIAARHIEEMRRDPHIVVDDIEVYLVYRVNLADRLDLPAQPRHMHYAEYSRVTADQIRRAGAQVLAGENPEELSRSLAQREFWQGFVRNRYPQRFEALAAPYHEQLEQAEQEAGSRGEQHYLDRAATLMEALSAEERALYLELARAAYLRQN
ncbi:NEL-type E3 ubiquitin ligase domain-containing protein [Pseudomonas sp. JR33AA]|uniref:NEL-type E3 ubiquitin ligase domain-containing protein n=1 Tax=Pseudomonas sp. JR33AA TaxID=2899113 RepID=UPI001F176689|nr:NEL-type E3 ubiquitin ligase domain-containing protein [Pseudomonas sp. JR33AA]MCE5977490.1 hypothetical protein [Pseudomonas sp. JR33AA]